MIQASDHQDCENDDDANLLEADQPHFSEENNGESQGAALSSGRPASRRGITAALQP